MEEMIQQSQQTGETDQTVQISGQTEETAQIGQENAQELSQVLDKKKRSIFFIASAAVALLVILIGVAIYSAPANRLQRQLDLGHRYLDEMDYEQAIMAFEAAISIDSRCEDAYLGMADAYAKMGEYETSLANYDKLIELDDGNERMLTGLGNCLEEYIAVLSEREQYDEIRALAEKYGNLAVGVDFLSILGEPAGRDDSGTAGLAVASPVQVDIRETDIEADSVFNTEGYGSIQIQSVGDMWIETDDGWFENDAFLPPQAALVDADGNMVFPYQYTFQRYYVSDDTVSLTEGSPYGFWSAQGVDIDTPIYCRFDGSILFDTASGDNQIDETTSEWFVWHGGPVQDGYALVIKREHTNYIGFGNGAGNGFEEEAHSYIMDQNGAIICVLPDEYNEIEYDEVDDWSFVFKTKYSLGWCGEGLFAVFENRYDENWNYSCEAKGYLDSAGNMALDLSGRGFTNLWPFHEGLAAVCSEDNLIGFINKSGELVIPCIYESYSGGFSEDGICAVQEDGKWGYIDWDNNMVIPFEYDDAYGADAGLASVIKDGKCGLVDYKNRIVADLEYDDISSPEEGVAYAIKDRKLYIITVK